MESIKKGRNIVRAIIAFLLIFDIISTVILAVLYEISGRMDLTTYKLAQGGFRLILTILLMYFLYKGHGWAKWITTIILLLGGIAAIITTISDFMIIMLLLGVVYVVFGVILIASKNVSKFFEYQKDAYIDWDETQ